MPSLLLLPSEIRLEIYRHLLRLTTMVELRYKSWGEVKERMLLVETSECPSGLHAEILATCRKIHSEAGAVLYRENRFVIRCYEQSGIRRYIDPEPRFPFYKLAAIKDLTISVYHHYDIEYMITPVIIAGILRYLFWVDCSLSRLALDLSFSSRQEHEHFGRILLFLPTRPLLPPWKEPFEIKPTFAVSKVALDTNIAAAIYALNISDRIDINFLDQVGETAALFETFVRTVASVKNWSCTLREKRHHLVKYFEIVQCKWSLCPAEDAKLGLTTRVGQADD